MTFELDNDPRPCAARDETRKRVRTPRLQNRDTSPLEALSGGWLGLSLASHRTHVPPFF